MLKTQARRCCPQLSVTGWPMPTVPPLLVHTVSSPGVFTPSGALQPNWA